MFELFHCILQVEINNNKFYSVVMDILWKNQFLFISTMFHCTGAKLDCILVKQINVVGKHTI